MQVRIKFKPDLFVNAHVYKDDTSQSVADRVFRQANLHPTTLNKEKRRQLAEIIESNVNNYIY